MAWITWGDMVDLWHRLRTRGWGYLSRRLRLSAASRVKQSWDSQRTFASSWWHIPAVQKRWNRLATGDPDRSYEDYLYHTYLKDRPDLNILSIGCGNAGHERLLAAYPDVALVHGIDLSPARIAEANALAAEAGLANTRFEAGDVFRMALPQHAYDVVLFHSSLHHFSRLEEMLGSLVPQWLKPDGLLVLWEFVGPTRFQWTKAQLDATNALLRNMPPHLRTRAGSSSVKQRVYRPGTWRMVLADPSESVRSSELLPLLHRYFEPLEERPLGGNLLHLLFHDIAHHFISPNKEAEEWLAKVFDAENQFLKVHMSDHIFGIYTPTDK
jgi:SAM-dependent methyltransferase